MGLHQYNSLMRTAKLCVLASVVFFVLSVSWSIAQSGAQGDTTLAKIAQGFASPPAESLPMVRWWWFGAAVQKPEILRELEQMKADGIGGAELAFVYPEALDDPSTGLRNLPFLSPEMLDAVSYAETEGRRLGLRIDVTLCSGWPYGGPATTLAEAAGRLRVLTIPVPPNATSLPVPKLADGESILSTAIAEGTAEHWNAASAVTLSPGTGIPASAAVRVALVFIASHTGQQVKRAAVGAEGYVLDPFSREAVATHLRAVGEPLVRAFGATPPFAIFSDSLEAYGADWTPALPVEFKKRRGYDLLPLLPELVAGGSPAADKVRHDYGRTLTELVNENYLVQIEDWARAHHTKFRSQTYGEPAVSFASQRLADLAEGEGPQWRTFSTLRWATSANHVYGKNVSSGETFTWLHSPVFRATPLDMKAEADIDFIMGENQLIYHGWPYSPPQAGEPGWSLYAAAVFNEHNPWHPVMPLVDQYIARLSYLLRQGRPANQVALLLPTDDAWASFSPGKVSISGDMAELIPTELTAAILSAGYNFDFIDADSIDRAGIPYSVLVLPPTDRIPVETLRKIKAWVDAGGKVVAVGRIPSMDSEGNATPELVSLVHRVFDSNNTTLEAAQIGDYLHRTAAPDLAFANSASRDSIGFIRRRLPDGDIYFVVNTSNLAITSRLKLATAYGAGARWNPETGAVEETVDPKAIELSLAPYESAVFVFSEEPQSHPLRQDLQTSLPDIRGDWSATFTGTHQSLHLPMLGDWSIDPATRHYSGEVVYQRSVTLPTVPAGAVYLQVKGGGPASDDGPASATGQVPLGPDGLPDPRHTVTGPGMHAHFDGPVREAALLSINGKPAGALWHPPYCLDVATLLQAGTNEIEIRVYNTALNAWSALAPRDYKPLIAKYGDRFQMQDLDRVKPLPSGILGKVELATSCAR